MEDNKDNTQEQVTDEAEQPQAYNIPETLPASSNSSYFRNRNVKDKQGEPVTIGDATFLVGRPSLSSLTKQRIIPTELAAAAANVQTKVSKGSPVQGKELESYQKYERLMLMSAVRSPRIVEQNPNYEDNEICIDDLSDNETTDLMTYIQGGAEALRTFRAQRQRQIAGLSSESLSDNEA